VQGEERAALNMGIGWRGLNRMMERFKDNMEFTKLKPKMAGIDPDDVYSEVPYEKGFQFLWRIERQVGGSMGHCYCFTLQNKCSFTKIIAMFDYYLICLVLCLLIVLDWPACF
jgi:hypothetical protein